MTTVTSSTAAIPKLKGIEDWTDWKMMMTLELGTGGWDWAKGTLRLHQEYTNSILKEFGMENCEGRPVPLEHKMKLWDFEMGYEGDFKYQKLIGSLLYLSTNTRPDISYAVSFLSQFNSCYTSTHWDLAKAVLSYLKLKPHFGVNYSKCAKPSFSLVGYSDADWAGNPTDYESYTGFCFTLDGNLVSWESRKERCTAQSTAESESIALAEATKQSLYLAQKSDISPHVHVPMTAREAMESRESIFWVKAMEDESQSFNDCKAWTLVAPQTTTKLVRNKWVFKKKTSPDGSTLFRARLVAKGYTQTYGVDYYETFAPVVKRPTLRLLFSLAVNFDLKIGHLDVKTAFLNGDLLETVYMAQPEGFVAGGCENHVCKLHKAVYGLKQAARSWNLKADSVKSSRVRQFLG
ncbi:hypothetical protein ONE63_003400 [Megalurothrips usitatus]|uniref:Reverse transcriptase Ty1/copia-type domain-containing protein n=1 Tax=Megalurothrips usitatus TaxID=439358 RepID=A0AAV7X9K7_9NEOP|nr:hypothetical protein ONE63_003400 [Megalurothrips usitatus]